jgi:hypothetical protein
LLRRRRISPTDTTPAETPLSEALEAGDLVFGGGVMRVISKDAEHFAELIAARWANRKEFVDFVHHHPWGKGKPQERVDFIFYMAATETITATVRDKLMSLAERGVRFADRLAVPRKQERLAMAAAAGTISASCADELYEAPLQRVSAAIQYELDTQLKLDTQVWLDKRSESPRQSGTN